MLTSDSRGGTNYLTTLSVDSFGWVEVLEGDLEPDDADVGIPIWSGDQRRRPGSAGDREGGRSEPLCQGEERRDHTRHGGEPVMFTPLKRHTPEAREAYFQGYTAGRKQSYVECLPHREEQDDGHCSCWDEGKSCCHCYARPMTGAA